MEERARRIVETAIELAEQGGFEAVRLRDVAAHAGVALGTVYKRFKSKEDILVAALTRDADEFETLMSQHPIPGDSAVQRVGQFFALATTNFLAKPNFARAVLNGMARNYREAWDQITAITAGNHCAPQLFGAGNGLRENDVLASAVSAEFGTALKCSLHREEAAYGAALVGATSAGVFDSLGEACRIIRYEQVG